MTRIAICKVDLQDRPWATTTAVDMEVAVAEWGAVSAEIYNYETGNRLSPLGSTLLQANLSPSQGVSSSIKDPAGRAALFPSWSGKKTSGTPVAQRLFRLLKAAWTNGAAPTRQYQARYDQMRNFSSVKSAFLCSAGCVWRQELMKRLGTNSFRYHHDASG